MAEVLIKHCMTIGNEGGWYCSNFACGSYPDLQSATEHVAEVLAANGYGKLEDAWDEGQKSGMRHADRVIAAHKIGRPELPGPPSPNPYRETGADGADAVTGFPRAAYQKRRMG